MGWLSLEIEGTVQVVPDFELGHALDVECWCGPRLEVHVREGVVPEQRVVMVSHRDVAERSGQPQDSWRPAG